MGIEKQKGGERMKDFNEREFYDSMYAFVRDEGAKAVERSCAYEWGTDECNREIETANDWYNALLTLETIMERKGYLK